MGDDGDVADVGTVDEERARHGVMERGGCLVAGASAHELTGLEREPRVGITARRLDRYADLRREHAQSALDRGPLLIAERLRRAARRRIRMQLERKPTRLYAELLRRLLDPDRAEITERSNDVRPDEKTAWLAHDMVVPIAGLLHHRSSDEDRAIAAYALTTLACSCIL